MRGEPARARAVRSRQRAVDFETVSAWIGRIPDIERVALSLHCSGLGQRAIGDQLGLRHQSVYYRLHRGAHRLRFLAFWIGTAMEEGELRRDLSRHLAPATVLVLATTLRTTSLAGTRRVLRASRKLVRYHFHAGVRRLARLHRVHADLEPYHLAFSELRAHLGILHEGRVQHRYRH